MVPPTRRHVLASVAGLGGLGGCTSLGARESTGTTTKTDSPDARSPEPTDTDSPTPPDTSSTPTSSFALDLEFLAVVVRQPSEDAPGRIRASLTNHTDETIVLEGGDPLPGGYGVEQVDASTPLVLFAEESDRINYYQWRESHEPATIDDAVYDGCWKLPDDIVSTLAGSQVRLPQNTTVAADFFVLGEPEAGCPSGTYEAHGGEMLAHPDETTRPYRAVTTKMQIQVGPSGSFSVEGSVRVEES